MTVRERKQLGALLFCAMAAVGILYLSQGKGLWVLGIVLSATVLLYFGKPVDMGEHGIVFSLLSYGVFLWNILLLGKLAQGVSQINGTESPLPGLFLLLLCGYGLQRKNLLSLASVIFFAFAITMGILFLFSLPAVELGNIRLEERRGIEFLPYGLLPILFIYVYRGKENTSSLRWSLGILALLGGIVLSTAGLGAADFYTASKSVNLLGAMERLEPFVAALTTAGGFCTMGFLLLVNRNLVDFREIQKRIWMEKGEILCGILSLLLINRIPESYLALGTTVCWGVIPVIQQGVVILKENAKKLKKSEKSA